MRPNVSRGTTALEVLPSPNSKIPGDRSFADDLIKNGVFLSCRVALLLRSSEI